MIVKQRIKYCYSLRGKRKYFRKKEKTIFEQMGDILLKFYVASLNVEHIFIHTIKK